MATSRSSSTGIIPAGLPATLAGLLLHVELDELLLELLLLLELELLELPFVKLLLLLLPQFDPISTCCSSAAVGSSRPKSESSPVPVKGCRQS